ncbi:hypothetical protein [Sphingomonas sp.]|uniref:hypothetical protein n=1 Tax=Sphingomonas sp. TaxID=28214 RepID=UPI003D6D1CA5
MSLRKQRLRQNPRQLELKLLSRAMRQMADGLATLDPDDTESVEITLCNYSVVLLGVVETLEAILSDQKRTEKSDSFTLLYRPSDRDA